MRKENMEGKILFFGIKSDHSVFVFEMKLFFFFLLAFFFFLNSHKK